MKANADLQKWIEFIKTQYCDDPKIIKFWEEKEKEKRAEAERIKKEREIRDEKRRIRSEKIKETHKQHDKLIELGSKYIMKNSVGKWTTNCSIVTTELTNAACEQPDVLGFANGIKSVLLEAKISRADFLKDFEKKFRKNPEEGMGEYRLYIAPKGLIKVEELPRNWGLIEVLNNRCYLTKKAEQQKADKESEMYVLTSLIKRIGQNAPKGVSIRCYTYETKNKASLIVEKDMENENKNKLW